jgi:hypothetical protein
MIAEAYWITPKNEVIPVGQTHIEMIVTNPEKFGLTKDYILKVHKKHKEEIGTEGDAREEIMVGLIKDGWIRVRSLPKDYSIKFQVVDFKESTIDRVELAIKAGSKRKLFNGVWAVSILNLKGEDFVEMTDELTIKDVVSGALQDKKFRSRMDKGYTSLARMYHENFKFLNSIDELNNAKPFKLNELDV